MVGESQVPFSHLSNSISEMSDKPTRTFAMVRKSAVERGRMKIINCPREFRIRTGFVMDLDFEFLDIVPSTRLGCFARSRLSELVDFCQNNPEYHIISHLRRVPIKVNAVVEAAAFYLLGEGDADPELMYVRKMSADALSKLHILKFDAG